MATVTARDRSGGGGVPSATEAVPRPLSEAGRCRISSFPSKQRRRGPAPLASFEDLSMDKTTSDSSPDDQVSGPPLPNIGEETPSSMTPVTPVAPVQHLPLGSSLSVPASPRIRVSAASSSSAHDTDSRESTPERELFSGYAKTGFCEEMTADFKSSTEELDADDEEKARRKRERDRQLADMEKREEVLRVSESSRKGSSSSVLSDGLLPITSGHSSRLSSLGSIGSARRSPSPHKMLLETSFCGNKPIQQPSIDLEDPPITTTKLVNFTFDKIERVKSPMEAKPPDIFRSSSPITFKSRAEEQTMEVVALKAAPIKKSPSDRAKSLSGDRSPKPEAQERPKLLQSGQEQQERSIQKLPPLASPKSPRMAKKVPVPTVPDLRDSSRASPSPSAASSAPEAIPVTTPDQNRAHTSVTSYTPTASPKTSRRPSARRTVDGSEIESGSSSPSFSRKSSFTNLFRKSEGVLSPVTPDSPSSSGRKSPFSQFIKSARKEFRSRSRSRSRSKSRERELDDDTHDRRSVLSIFRPKQKKKDSEGERQGRPEHRSSSADSKISEAITNVEFTFNNDGTYQSSEFGLIRQESEVNRAIKEPLRGAPPISEGEVNATHAAISSRDSSFNELSSYMKNVDSKGSTLNGASKPAQAKEKVQVDDDVFDRAPVSQEIAARKALTPSPAVEAASPAKQKQQQPDQTQQQQQQQKMSPQQQPKTSPQQQQKLSPQQQQKQQVEQQQEDQTKPQLPPKQKDRTSVTPDSGEPVPPKAAAEAPRRESAHDPDHPTSESERESEMEYIKAKNKKPTDAAESPDVENKVLVSQESFEEGELPYVPTTLPQERPMAVPMVPVKERVAELRMTQSIDRPRSATPIMPNKLEEFKASFEALDIDDECDKLMINIPSTGAVKVLPTKSPKKQASQSWADFCQEGLKSPRQLRKQYRTNSQQSSESDRPPPLPPKSPKSGSRASTPGQSLSQGTTPTGPPKSWINFDEMPDVVLKPVRHIKTVRPRGTSGSSREDSRKPVLQKQDRKDENQDDARDDSGRQDSCECECHGSNDSLHSHPPHHDHQELLSSSSQELLNDTDRLHSDASSPDKADSSERSSDSDDKPTSPSSSEDLTTIRERLEEIKKLEHPDDTEDTDLETLLAPVNDCINRLSSVSSVPFEPATGSKSPIPDNWADFLLPPQPGRRSRLSSLGSDAGSIGRSPSPNMLLETSFCGSQPIEDPMLEEPNVPMSVARKLSAISLGDLNPFVPPRSDRGGPVSPNLLTCPDRTSILSDSSAEYEVHEAPAQQQHQQAPSGAVQLRQHQLRPSSNPFGMDLGIRSNRSSIVSQDQRKKKGK
ncbi:uncharacterized protein LOC143036832 isoform X2 [Oratosquilla oratoria]|uniref:uncharacterized protein LOC143036832 isoform X2 n=1 Tax=Oratosquilla oratoria TaxID=337810 RepID=UPI003F7723A3